MLVATRRRARAAPDPDAHGQGGRRRGGRLVGAALQRAPGWAAAGVSDTAAATDGTVAGSGHSGAPTAYRAPASTSLPSVATRPPPSPPPRPPGPPGAALPGGRAPARHRHARRGRRGSTATGRWACRRTRRWPGGTGWRAPTDPRGRSSSPPTSTASTRGRPVRPLGSARSRRRGGALGRGARVTYRVTRWPASTRRSSTPRVCSRVGPARLHLVTCTGDYVAGRGIRRTSSSSPTGSPRDGGVLRWDRDDRHRDATRTSPSPRRRGRVARALSECTAVGPLLLGIATRSLGNRHDAEDVVQQVFVSAWKSRGTLRPSEHALPAWLIGIARRRTADEFARRSREAARRRIALDPRGRRARVGRLARRPRRRRSSSATRWRLARTETKRSRSGVRRGPNTRGHGRAARHPHGHRKEPCPPPTCCSCDGT